MIVLMLDAQERGDDTEALLWLERAFSAGYPKFNKSVIGRAPSADVLDRFWKRGVNAHAHYMSDPMLQVGQLAADLGYYQGAIFWLMHAVAEGSAEAVGSLANLYDGLGNEDEARFWAAAYPVVSGDWDAVLAEALACQEEEDWAGAKQWLTRGVLLGDMRAQELLTQVTREEARKKASRAPATENRLGNDIERVFQEPRVAQLVKRGFGAELGLNKDYIVAWIQVSEKLVDSPSDSQYLVLTTQMLGLFQKKTFTRQESAQAFPLSSITEIGVGESNHYEMQGFSGRGSDYVTFTIRLADGRKLTRHSFLGHNEAQANAALPRVRDFLQRAMDAQWPLADGPGYDSQGGYRSSIGFGIGVWH